MRRTNPGWPRLKISSFLLLFLLLLPVAISPRVSAQQDLSLPIFQRFSRLRETPISRMSMYEIPVVLRPQTYPDAKIDENLGLGYILALGPRNQVFVTLGVNWGRMQFQPKNPEVASIDVNQVDLTQSLNFWLWRRIVIHLGAGLGIMDTFVLKSDGKAEHQTVPYIPLSTGLLLPLGRTFIGLRLVHSPFMGDGAASGNTRVLLGLGYSF